MQSLPLPGQLSLFDLEHPPLDDGIPYGYCKCGCGQETPVFRRTDATRGNKKGEPRRFCPGHNRTRPVVPVVAGARLDPMYGLCRCGCGLATKPAPIGSRSRGLAAGEPQRWIAGHRARGLKTITPPQYVELDLGYATPCHLWQAKVGHWGYGVLHDGTGRQLRAHRALYEALVRPLGPEEVLDHLCRQKACCNIEHLDPVTQAENVRRGAATRLSAQQVAEVRHSRLGSLLLSKRYGVTAHQIYAIRRGLNWWDPPKSTLIAPLATAGLTDLGLFRLFGLQAVKRARGSLRNRE